jgi:hypothetical protein
MAYKRIVAAVLFTAFLAGSAQAQSPASPACRKKCDTSFSSCTKRSKSGETYCLRTWHKCKAQCSASAAAAPQAAEKPTAVAMQQSKRR